MTLITPREVNALRRKFPWSVRPLVFLLYIATCFDRAKVGLAKLRMADDLKFCEEVFDVGIGIFFIGYLILEIPGVLLVERCSAWKWFARILIAWGFILVLTVFVQTIQPRNHRVRSARNDSSSALVQFFAGRSEVERICG
ncbi:MAG: hypothetical protein HY298_09005 [Verrucomicrobia bacterium]|nr:hypothetical protein [Verrucomicrobiota bacterium]